MFKFSLLVGLSLWAVGCGILILGHLAELLLSKEDNALQKLGFITLAVSGICLCASLITAVITIPIEI